ncbi:MAG: 16S rRNA (uracil(1498)-N(3))-methyltransferase [Pseudohongiella sp.]|nr:16S rRNA (uracil(1498)-N(3))-methyltransferase [Pseudohongiella sp.]
MRLSRLYCDSDLLAGSMLTLADDHAHYLGKVLRVKPGHKLALFNGRDGEFTAEIISVSKRDIEVKLSDTCNRLPEILLPVHIGLGLSRGERMDYAIQKATELGVTQITPLFTEFSEVRLDSERADKRTAHWQKVASSASEQCGRCTVPVISNPVSIKDWLGTVPAGQGFMLDHTGTHGFTGEQPDKVYLLIGPEGGTSEDEKTLALQAGFSTVRLGPRVLRTETAPVVALTALQLQWGDF